MRLYNLEEVDRLTSHLRQNGKSYKNMNEVLRRCVLLGLDVLEGATGDDANLVDTAKLHDKLDAVIQGQGLIVQELRKLGDKFYLDLETIKIVLNQTYKLVRWQVFPDDATESVDFERVCFGEYTDLNADFGSKTYELRKLIESG